MNKAPWQVTLLILTVFIAVAATVSTKLSDGSSVYSVHSNILTNSVIGKTNSGRLYHVVGGNQTAGTLYFQLYDTNAVPADGTVPLVTVQVPTAGTVGVDWVTGRPFEYGIVGVWSSTGPTKTIAATNSGFIDIVLK